MQQQPHALEEPAGGEPASERPPQCVRCGKRVAAMSCKDCKMILCKPCATQASPHASTITWRHITAQRKLERAVPTAIVPLPCPERQTFPLTLAMPIFPSILSTDLVQAVGVGLLLVALCHRSHPQPTLLLSSPTTFPQFFAKAAHILVPLVACG